MPINSESFNSKRKGNGDIEFAPVYFNSTSKTVLILNMTLINLFKKLYRIWFVNWICGEGIREYICFSPLSGSTDIKLPRKLRKSFKGLISIKNSDNKCFLWYHIRHWNLLETHPERITKADINMVNDLD